MPQLTPTLDSSGLQQLSKNLRTTVQGQKLGRALFSGGNADISPRAITQALLLMGLKVPVGVQITADVAQVLISGSATYTAVQDYEDLSDVGDVLNASASTVRAAADIAVLSGWAKKDDPAVQILEVGTDIAMIVASGGMNVLAWMSLALDVYNIYSGIQSSDQNKADQYVHEAIAKGYGNIVRPECIAAAGVTKLYQESKNLPDGTDGKLTVFGFIGEMAKVAPDLFPQYFPQLETFFPHGMRTLSASASYSTSFLGMNIDTKSASLSKTWDALYQMTDDQIRSFIFEGMIYPTIYPFMVAEQYYIQKNKASLFTMSLLSTFDRSIFKLNPGIDYSYALDKSFLAPSDFNENVLQNFLLNLPNPHSNLSKKSAITINGKSTGFKTTLAQQNASFLYDHRQDFLNADHSGRMDLIRTQDPLKNILRDYFTFENIPYDQAQGVWNETINTGSVSPRDAKAMFDSNSPGTYWRDPRNYYSALALLDTLQKDPYFKSWNANGKFGNWLVQKFDFMKDLKTFENAHREIQLKQTLRCVNTLAKANIAQFFNTTSKNIVKINKNDGSPVVYARKG